MCSRPRGGGGEFLPLCGDDRSPSACLGVRVEHRQHEWLPDPNPGRCCLPPPFRRAARQSTGSPLASPLSLSLSSPLSCRLLGILLWDEARACTHMSVLRPAQPRPVASCTSLTRNPQPEPLNVWHPALRHPHSPSRTFFTPPQLHPPHTQHTKHAPSLSHFLARAPSLSTLTHTRPMQVLDVVRRFLGRQARCATWSSNTLLPHMDHPVLGKPPPPPIWFPV